MPSINDSIDIKKLDSRAEVSGLPKYSAMAETLQNLVWLAGNDQIVRHQGWPHATTCGLVSGTHTTCDCVFGRARTILVRI